MLFLIDAEGNPYNKGIRELGVVLVNRQGYIVKSWLMTDPVKIEGFLQRRVTCLVWGSYDKVLARNHCHGSYNATLIDVSNHQSLDSVCRSIGVEPSTPRHCAIKDAVTLYKVCRKTKIFRRFQK